MRKGCFGLVSLALLLLVGCRSHPEIPVNDENVKISITYEGVTYSRANTTLGNLALGGRTSVSLQGNEVEMTFEVVGIKKYGDASLSGYYKGAVTVIE